MHTPRHTPADAHALTCARATAAGDRRGTKLTLDSEPVEDWALDMLTPALHRPRARQAGRPDVDQDQ